MRSTVTDILQRKRGCTEKYFSDVHITYQGSLRKQVKIGITNFTHSSQNKIVSNAMKILKSDVECWSHVRGVRTPSILEVTDFNHRLLKLNTEKI